MTWKEKIRKPGNVAIIIIGLGAIVYIWFFI